MGAFMPFLTVLSRVIIVVGINFSLFVIVPLSAEIFANFTTKEQKAKSEPKLLAEMVKPKKEPPKKAEASKVRQVSSSSGKSMQSSTSKFNLSPDLGVAGAGEGGAEFASGEMGAQVFEEGDVDQQAVPVYFPQPAFPEEAKKLGLGGEVAVFFTVGTNGKVISIEKVQAPHASFDRAVRKTFAEWKFNPATNQGVPVNSRKSIVIDFALQN